MKCKKQKLLAKRILTGFYLFVTLVGVSFLIFQVGCSTQEEYPNIVLIFADDLGYADLGTYGASGFETPHLDKMAEEGMRFTDFHSSTAVCSASRASLLTGCYSERVSIRGALGPSSPIGLNPIEENIASLLKKKGYKTAIFGKWHLGHHEQFLPLQQGFDQFIGLPYSNDMWPVGYDGKPSLKGWKENYPILQLISGNEKIDTIKNLEDQAKLTTLYTENAVKFIEENSNERFFLYVPHSMPHVPLGVSDKFKDKSEQGLYGDVIMEIDWSVGQILEALKKNGLEENTIVIFTSDNGPWLNYGNHAGSALPLREGKGTMWEGGNRVPCIIKWPNKISEKSECNNLASTIDIFPTIASITNSELPNTEIDGVDISSLLYGKADSNPRDEFWYYYDYDLIAVRKNDWKLYFPCTQRSYEGKEPGADGYPGETWQRKIDYELYNLKTDISERNNILEKHPDIVEKLKLLGDSVRVKLGDRLTKTKGRENREPGRIGNNRVKFEKHLGVKKNISLKTKPNDKYGYGNNNIIIDGVSGSLDYNDGNWLGFEEKDFEAVIDLGSNTKVTQVSASFLQNQDSWIFSPELVTFAISSDGKKYRKLESLKGNSDPNQKMEAKYFTKELNSQTARFIKVSAKNIRKCPEWHKGAGGKAWIFIDEITVK
jgi:arylsulfatase